MKTERAKTEEVGTRRPKLKLSARRREYVTGYLLVSPQVVGFAIFVLGPIVAIFWYSLHEWNALSGRYVFTGLGNFEQMVSDPVIGTVARATAVFSLGLVPLGMALALLLAVLLNQRLPGTRTFAILFFAPVVISLTAWTIVWGFLLRDDGAINSFLTVMGVGGPNWLREPNTAMVSVIVVQVVKNVGINMIIFLAALQTVPKELIEAARLDGAGTWAIFRRITFPLISPTVLLVAILIVIGSLQVFVQILLLTHGGPGNSTTVLVYYLYRQAFEFSEFGYASSLAVVLFSLALALTVGQWRLRKKWVFYEA